MTDVRDLLESAADRGSQLAQPPAFSRLRRRRRRRSAVRWGAATLGVAAAFTTAGASGLVAQAPSSDSIVAARQPTTAPVSAEPVPAVPAGQVFIPAQFRGEMVFAPDAVPAGDLLWSHMTKDGLRVTAGQRRGDLVCIADFAATGAADAIGAMALCEPIDGIRFPKAGQLDVSGAYSGPTGEQPDRVLLNGSAPAGTRTVVISAPDREAVRLEVLDAGPQYAHRAWFGTEWALSESLVQAFDVDGRLLVSRTLDMSRPASG